MSVYLKMAMDLLGYRFARHVLFAAAFASVLLLANVHWVNADQQGSGEDDCHVHEDYYTISAKTYFVVSGASISIKLPSGTTEYYMDCSVGVLTSTSWSKSGLPGGITLDSSTGRLTGSIDALGSYPGTSTHNYTFTSTEGNINDTGSATGSITIKVGETLSIGGVLSKNIVVNEYANVSLPFAYVTGGWGTGRTYKVAGVDAPGLTSSGSSYASQSNTYIRGTPTQVYEDTVTFYVKDTTSGRTASTRFKIIVGGADKSPSFSSSVSDKTYTRGSSITPVILPTASGGDGTLTYSLSSLPTGLSFSSSTRTISGTPTVAVGKAMTYKATDEDGDEAELNFSITVNAPASPPPPPPTAASFGTQTVSNQGYVKDVAISELVLPAASSGSGTKTYRLTPPVPGLTFSSGTRTLSGTPTEVKDHAMTYAVSNSAGSDSLTFIIDVAAADTAPGFGSSTVATQTFEKDADIGTVQLPAATGGNGSLTYSLTPAVPGLNFNAVTQLLTGKPTAVGTTTMTYKVSDEDSNTEASDTASLMFDIVVAIADLEITGFAGAVNNQSYVKGRAIQTLQLPLAQGGNAPITYELTPTISGLDFDTASRQLTGTPDTSGRSEMTYTATDSDSPTADTASLNFVITVDGIPEFGDDVGNQVYQDGVAITTLTLPAATGGDDPVAYTLTPTVPGLVFDDKTRELTGAPSAGGAYSMVYRATDDDGDGDSLTFSIRINSTPSFSDSIADMEFDVDLSMGLITLPAADGGNEPVSYQLVPVPNGLTFYPVTRHLAGIPSGKGTFPTNYIATDADGETATQSFSIEVVDSNTAPGHFSSAVPAQVYTVNEQVRILQLPTAVGGNAPFSYTLEPAVPGLTFHRLTRQVTGTPTEAVEYDMTYEVTDADGQKASLQFKIHVKNIPPEFPLGSRVPDKLFLVGKEITPLVFPSAVGGNGDLTYSVEPPVPGLTVDSDERRWSGTPTEVVDYTVSLVATDASDDQATIQFRVLVREKIEDPSFGSVSSVNWEIGEGQGPSAPVGEPLPVAAVTQKGLVYSLSGDDAGAFQVRGDGQVQLGANTRLDYEAKSTYVFSLEVRNNLDIYGGLDDTVDDSVLVTVTVMDEDENTFGVRFGSRSRGVSVGAQRYMVGMPINPLHLPEASWGQGKLQYRLHPIPSGLNFNQSALLLTGTPDYEFDGTVTLTASTGSVSGGRGDYAEISFRVTVVRQIERPDFGDWEAIADQVYALNREIEPLELPRASGGNAPLEYTLQPRVPGLRFDHGRLRLSGTPEQAGVYTMRYHVEDRDSDRKLINFQVRVVSEEQLMTIVGPGAPREVAASTVGENSDPVVVLSWRAPATEGSGPVTHYHVERSANRLVWQEVGEVKAIAGRIEFTYGDSAVTRGDEWSYRVLAVNEMATGPASEIVSVLVGSDSRVTGGLQPPGGLDYLVKEVSVRVFWTESGSGNAYQLDIWYAGHADWVSYGNGGALNQWSVELACCDDDDPIPEWARVRTVQVHGPQDQSESAWSGSLRIHTEEQVIGEVLAPTGLDAVMDHGLIQLWWTAVPNMNGYQVEMMDTQSENLEWAGVDHGSAGFVQTNRVLVPCCYEEVFYIYQFRVRSVLLSRDGRANYSDWSLPLDLPVDRRPEVEETVVELAEESTEEVDVTAEASTSEDFNPIVEAGQMAGPGFATNEGLSFLGMEAKGLSGLLVLVLAAVIGAGSVLIYFRRRGEAELEQGLELAPRSVPRYFDDPDEE